ncbi:MAG: SPOR domain-containing protein [Christensenellales bacterium]|nr:SPOR domain-containing protein [Christensenellales bacterium]
MEFSRRRRRRPARRSSQPGSSGAGKAVMAMLMLAGIVYLVSASAAGTWLAEKVMAPAFEALASLGREQEDLTAPETEDVQQVSLSTAPSSRSEDIALPALTCYTLQMGVFSSAENAQKQSDTLKSQGAGGYVLQDGDRYRVLAAGYALESEAKEVKDRLVSEGMDCTVYAIEAPGATFRVSAEEGQLAQVESGFSALYQAQEAMTQAAIAFDRDGQNVSDGQAAVQQIQQDLEQQMAALAAYGDSAPAIASLLACKGEFTAVLSPLVQSGASSHTEFAAALKYAQLAMTHSYEKMVFALTA